MKLQLVLKKKKDKKNEAKWANGRHEEKKEENR